MNERAIKKLRRKFILISMVSFVTVMMLITATIYVGNVVSTIRQTVKTLNFLAQNGGSIELDPNDRQKAEDFRREQNSDNSFFGELVEDMFNTGIDAGEFIYTIRYFSVIYDSNSNPVRAITNHIVMVDDASAIEITKSALSMGSKYGIASGYPFIVDEKDGETVVICMDITAQTAVIRRIGNIAIVIILVGTILAYIFVRILSWQIIKPEMRAAEKQKQFITNASHELKTPLSVIRANTELEMMMHGEDEWNKSTMNQVDRMTTLINELVIAAKAEENDDEKELVEVDVTEIVTESADSFTPVATQDGKKLEKDIAENVKMRANVEQLRQLVNILTDNAIKYCDDGGTVTVSLSQRGRGIKLCVSNNYAEGENIDYSKFFERFYREDESHNIDKGGYGIGLSIAEGIVKNHRGSIDVSWKDGVICFECKLK